MPKILLLDDDSTFLNAFPAFVTAARTDIAIDTALCAEAGLLLIGTSEYDLIVSDFRMSGLDGLRLVKECKRLRPGTPVVLITGYGDRDMETEALHVGAYAFLHKPVPPDVLLSLVDRALRIEKEPASCEGHQACAAPSDPFVIERDRLLKRVQEINRFIQKQLESSGNDTVH
ncbi:MAG: response regulator [Nitrospirales bacterium]